MKNKILIIQTAFLGDAILTLPLIQKLKEKQNGSEVFVLCIPSTVDVFKNSDSVSMVIVYDKRKKDKSLLSYAKLILRIRREKFQTVISPHRSIRSTMISFFSGARITISFDKSDFSFLYKKVIKYGINKHEVQRNLALIDIDSTDWKILPHIRISEDAINRVSDLLPQHYKKHLIAIAPGSVWKTKVYPKEYFLELIKLITSNGYNVALVGGKEDENLCDSIKQNFSDNVFSFAGKLSIIESVELLKNCSALICNDSAPTHLAMAADIPVLTIYCSTIPAFGFYPYNKRSAYLSYDLLDCKPCGIHGHKECPINTFDCAYKLSPQIVFQKFKELLSA